MTLGQALAVDGETLANLFTMRGIWLAFARRRAQVSAYYREAARLAELAGNNDATGRALMNLSDVVTFDDPAGGVDVARAALVHLRRTGDKDLLGYALAKLDAAQVALGAWDAANESSSRASRATPYHLAHGLLDHAEHLILVDSADDAVLAIEEAAAIGARLGCRPLLDRAEAHRTAAFR